LGKQTSALFSALTCRTTFVDNVAYNGPRTGINSNDSFCHGHTITGNILFNWVWEAQNHGPINTWDRNMYVQRDPTTDQPTVVPQWTHLRRNFIMNGLSGNRNRGSNLPRHRQRRRIVVLYMSDNFLVYGGVKNYLGHDKDWIWNLIVHPGRWSRGPCAMIRGRKNHVFDHNTCVVAPGGRESGRGEELIPLVWTGRWRGLNVGSIGTMRRI